MTPNQLRAIFVNSRNYIKYQTDLKFKTKEWQNQA